MRTRITLRTLSNGYRTTIEIPCADDTSCVVAIVATYEPTFWEVIVH